MRHGSWGHRWSDEPDYSEAGAWTGWGTSSDDVDHAIADLDPVMNALNAGVAQCAQMAPTDKALWAQAYVRWQAVKSDWAFDKEGSIAPGPVYGTGILERVQLSNNDASAYQAKLAAACPALAPPAPNPLGGGGGANPTPPTPPEQPTSTLGWIAILGGLALAGYVLSRTGVPRVFGRAKS